MTDEQIDDLKQFMTTLIQQQVTSHIDTAKNELRQEIHALDIKLSSELNALDIKLSGKIDNIASYIGDALDTSNDETDKQIKNHEQRIALLETKIA